MDNTLNNTSNKFTGKERDQETGYDYFGARYYDSRIGRWLQTEPLYNKYLQFSPYIYSIDNSINYLDYNGFYVYILGKRAKDVFNYLKSYSDLELSYNPMTGIITTKTKYEDISTDNKADLLLWEAINSTKYTILLFERDNFMFDNTKESIPWMGGAWDGNKYDVATQYISFKDTKFLYENDFEEKGESAMHEILEAYIGVSENSNYKDAHEKVKKILGEKEEPPFGRIIKRFKDYNDNVFTMGFQINESTFIRLFIFDKEKNQIIKDFRK